MYSSDSQYPSVVRKWDYSLSETDSPLITGVTNWSLPVSPHRSSALYCLTTRKYCYNHKQIIVELETEKEIAQKALKTMMKQRNEADALLVALSSTVDAGGSEKQISSASVTDRSETCDEIKPEIEEGQLELRRPLKQRKDVSEQLDLHRDLLSPTRKVPPEIIRVIFLLWASDRHFFQSPTHVSPSVLTGVCVAWKNIALGMRPSYWSRYGKGSSTLTNIPLKGGLSALAPPRFLSLLKREIHLFTAAMQELIRFRPPCHTTIRTLSTPLDHQSRPCSISSFPITLDDRESA